MPVIIDGTSGITTPAVDTTTAITAADGGTGLTSVGASGNVLTSNGTTWTSAAAASGQLQTELFTAPGTWTKPASATQVRVTVIGGGGGGGSWAPGGAIPGKSGGSGGFAMAMVPVSAPVTITVGTGGVGGAQAAGGNPGTSGGTSSFGSAVSSTGGGGGGGPAIGTDGTGTVSTGTALKTGVAGSPSPTVAGNRATYGLPALGIFGGIRLELGSPAAVAFSTSSLNGAGAGGAGAGNVSGNAGGGIGGGILVEFIG